jgi:uncharacterized protein YcnI
MRMKLKILLGLGVAVGAVLALTPLASGHAVVSAIQPQGKSLTAARTAYVLRVPNEKAAQNTFEVDLLVPQAVQTAISVKQTSDWVTRLVRVDTGQKNAEGQPIMAVTKIRWIAKPGMDSQIEPGFYGEFYFRITNPATPQKLCFPVDQWYTKATSNGKPEAVHWNGDASSATPASCVDVVAS